MVNIGPRVHIRGAPEMLTKAGNIRRNALAEMRSAALARATESQARFARELGAEYRSPWAHNQVGKSIRAKVRNEKDGISIQFTARSGARDHIRYITGILPDSEWKRSPYPVVPFEIKAHDIGGRTGAIKIRQPGKVRKFIRNADTGLMEGARPGPILKKKVMWGLSDYKGYQGSGGFHRDAIAEISAAEGQSFVADMMAAVAAAIAKSTG